MSIKLLKSGEISEDTIEKLTVKYLSLRGFERYVIKIFNEGAGRARRCKKANGLRRGASDLFIAVPRHGKNGMWLELKSKHGKLSEEQIKFFEDMESQNYFTAVAWSFDEAKEFLDWYLKGDDNIPPTPSTVGR